jgi:hypothetical protein
MLTMSDFVAGLGWAHAAMGVAIPLLAWDMLRTRLRSPWPQLGAILIAVDPALVMWQRTVLTEELTTLLVMVCAWLFVKVHDVGTGGRWRGTMARAAVLGGALAAACYTRPNMQVFAVLAPLLLGGVALGKRSRPLALCAGACLACTALLLSPIFISNARTFSTPGLVVGADWNRAVWAWEDGLMDWNQSGVFTFDQFRTLRTLAREHRIASFTFPDKAQEWRTPPAPDDVHPRSQMDIRAGALWRESAARRGDMFLRTVPRAFASLMGVPMSQPGIFHGDAPFLLAPLLGDGRQCPQGTNWLTGFDRAISPEFEQTVHPIGNVAESWPARTLGAAFHGWAWLRPALAAAFLFAGVVLVRKRDWAFASLALIVVAHMAGVAVLMFCGNDRYAMPWYGLMTVVTLAGLAPRGAPGRERPAA